MTRRSALVLAIGVAVTTLLHAGQNDTARVGFETARKLESVDGDLKRAIDLYLRVAESGDRAIAEQAHLRLAASYRKLGNVEAQAKHEALARSLGALAAASGSTQAATSQTPTTSLVFAAEALDRADHVHITWDGRYVAMRGALSDGADQIIVRDLKTGSIDRRRWDDAAMLSPDGRRIAIVRSTGSGYDVVVENRRTPGKPVAILKADGSTPYLGEWSRDGRSVLMHRIQRDGTSDIVLWSISDNSVKPLVSLGHRETGDRPRLSPDGRYIAYSALPREPTPRPRFRLLPGVGGPPPPGFEQSVYVLDVNGSVPKEVVKGAGVNASPVWSPDGTHLLFISDRGGPLALYAVAIQKGDASAKPFPVRGSNISWNENDRIIPAPHRQVTLLGGTGSGALYYVKAAAGWDMFQQELGRDGRVRGRAVRISDSGINRNLDPVYSPDGTRIAFKRWTPIDGLPEARSFRLVIHDLTSGVETVSDLTGPYGDHVWTADGNGVLAAVLAGSGSRIMRVDVRSKSVVPVYSSSTVIGEGLAISPDGTTIYFTEAGGMGVTAVDVDSSQRRVLSKGFRVGNGLALSPDGRTLAITGEGKLRLLDMNGALTAELAKDVAPRRAVWSRDGSTLLYQDFRQRLMRIPATGGSPEYLGVNPAGYVSLRPTNSHIAYSTASPPELWKLDRLSVALRDDR